MITYLIKRPIALSIAVIFAVVLGIFAYIFSPITMLPNVTLPKISIRTNLPDAPSYLVEQSITEKLRKELETLESIEKIETKSTQGQSIIEIVCKQGTQMKFVFIHINEKIDQIFHLFPQGTERPEIIQKSSNEIPIVYLHFYDKNKDIIELSNICQKSIFNSLLGIDEVSFIDISGKVEEQISLYYDKDKIHTMGITIEQINQYISKVNDQLGTIYLLDGHLKFSLQAQTKLHSIEQLHQLWIILDNHPAFQLKEVARVHTEPRTKQGSHLLMGKESIVMALYKKDLASTETFNEKLEEKINQFKAQHPTLYITKSMDQSEILTKSVSNMLQTLGLGAVLVALVMFAFIRSVKLSFIIAFVIPLAIIISFIILKILNISINIISLSGLSLGVGMMIDNAIVILDNIVQKNMHSPADQACAEGVKEVFPALLSAMLTTLAVFAPLISLGGLTGALFFDQVVALAAVLACSLPISCLFLPMLYYYFIKNEGIQQSTKFYDFLQKKYKIIFIKTQKIKYFSLLLLCINLGVSALIFSLLTTELVAFEAPSKTKAIIDWNEQISFEENQKRAENISNKIINQSFHHANVGLQQFIVKSTQSSIEKVDFYIESNTAHALDSIKNNLLSYVNNNFPKAKVAFENIPNPIEQMIGQYEQEILIKVYPQNNNQVQTTELNEHLSSLGKILPLPTNDSIQTLNLHINHQTLLLYGIELNKIYHTINQYFTDKNITYIDLIGYQIPVIDKKSFTALEQALSEAQISHKNQTFPLAKFIHITENKQKKHIYADQFGQYEAFMLKDFQVENVAQIENIARSFSNSDQLIRLEGSFFEQQIANKKLAFVLIIAFMLLYVILAMQFESFLYPIIVLLTVPFGILGALLLLYFCSMSINAFSIIGMIVMMGIMINDAILKVDSIRKLSKQMPLQQAIEQAGQVRLKAILMTTFTTILAVLPLLFAQGEGAHLQKPYIISIIGGLMVGTLSALFFVPSLYQLLSTKKQRHSI